MLISLLVALSPLALYLFYLAGLNRRDRPPIVHGLWESAALLLGLSGFLLYTAPCLLNELYRRDLLSVPLEQTEDSFEGIWLKWSIVWVVYFVGITLLAIGMLLSRRNCRGIYNVDLFRCREVLFQTLAEKGLTGQPEGRTLLIFETGKLEGSEVTAQPEVHGEPRLAAELQVDAFAPLCHVTLHWRRGSREWSADFEAALAKNLEGAATEDNPAANWFLGIASLLFGVLFMVGAMWIFTQFFPQAL